MERPLLDRSFCRQMEKMCCKLEEPVPDFIFPRKGSVSNILFMLVVAEITQMLKGMCMHNSLKVLILHTEGKECSRLREKSHFVQWMLLPLA